MVLISSSKYCTDYFSSNLFSLLQRRHKRRNPKTILYVVTWMYLSVGFLVFMFLPSLVFVSLEGWSYIESLYYTFITLTTIGFGEYIGGW